MYRCVVYSAESPLREYEVKSQSAMKAADLYGKKEEGETVVVMRKKTYELLSVVAWVWNWDRSDGLYVRGHIPKDWRHPNLKYWWGD